MKKISKMSLFCAILLLLGCLQPLALSADALSAETIYTETVCLGTVADAYIPADDASGSLREEDAAQLLAELRTAVRTMSERVDVRKYELTDVTEIQKMLYYEIAEAFHLSYQFEYSMSNGKLQRLYLSYTMSQQEYENAMVQCERAAAKLLDGIKDNESLSDVQKALLLHDRLALHCEYGNPRDSYLDTSTMYGALVGRNPICQGYAMGYMYLLAQVGIRSEYASSQQLNHGWNIVYIDSKPYHVDVTWDDPTEDVYGRVLHNNFLLSTAAFKAEPSDHNADDFNSTPSDTTYDNYFWKNSEAAFQLVNGELYYIDHAAEEIRRMSDHKKLASVADKWYISATSYIRGNQARLACVNNTLYCSKSTAVYLVNMKDGGKLTKVYEPDLNVNGTKYFSINGFRYEDGIMDFRFARYENDDFVFVNKSFSVCNHTQTKVVDSVQPTCGKDGYTGKTVCAACGLVMAYGETVSATGVHTWIPGAVILQPTTQADGEQEYNCDVCGLCEIRSVPKLPEGFTDSEQVKMKNGQVFAAAGMDVQTLLQNAESGAYVENAQQQRLDADASIGTGKVLVMPDGSRSVIILLGDVDGDGTVSATDARSALRNAVHLDAFDDIMQTAADTDDNATITASDARALLRAAVHLDSPKDWLAFAA